MNVQDDPGTEDFRNKANKHKQVRHCMNRTAIALASEQARDFKAGRAKKFSISECIAEHAVATIALLPKAKELHAIDGFDFGTSRVGQSDEVYMVASARKRFRLTPRTRIGEVVGIRDHADLLHLIPVNSNASRDPASPDSALVFAHFSAMGCRRLTANCSALLAQLKSADLVGILDRVKKIGFTTLLK